MSDLEAVAQRVLSPLVLDNPSDIDISDRTTVSLWAHKTALVSMLLSSKEERMNGYGLPREEYRVFKTSALRGERLPRTSVWIGRYTGEWRVGLTRVVPIAVLFPGLPDPESPDGYIFTVVVGSLLILGLRFTSRTPGIPSRNAGRFLACLSPSADSAIDRSLEAVTDEQLLSVAKGAHLSLQTPGVMITPWAPASNLPESRARGPLVELPLMCGRHTAFYPAVLVSYALEGRFFSFATSCDCGMVYLIHTEADGAHTKAADSYDRITATYDALPGREVELLTSVGRFFCKEDPQGESFRRRV